MVLSLSPVDWAAEWLRLKSPSYKYVGPVLAEPGKALPAHLEVVPTCMHDAMICIGKNMMRTEGLVLRNQVFLLNLSSRSQVRMSMHRLIMSMSELPGQALS